MACNSGLILTGI